MDKNNKIKKDKLPIWISYVVIPLLFVLIVLQIFLLNSNVEVEGSCKIDKFSFDFNETQHIKNISLNEGSIECKFKGDVPFWILALKK